MRKICHFVMSRKLGKRSQLFFTVTDRVCVCVFLIFGDNDFRAPPLNPNQNSDHPLKPNQDLEHTHPRPESECVAPP